MLSYTKRKSKDMSNDDAYQNSSAVSSTRSSRRTSSQQQKDQAAPSSPTGSTASKSRSKSGSFIKRLSFKFKSKSVDTNKENGNNNNTNYSNKSSTTTSPVRNSYVAASPPMSYSSPNYNTSYSKSGYASAAPTSSYVNGYAADDVQLNIETMQKVFNVFDRDHDGSITIGDVEAVMNSLQYLHNELEMPSLEQIRVAFDKFDENKNGSIEFDEFLNILKSAAAQTAIESSSNQNLINNNNYGDSSHNETYLRTTVNKSQSASPAAYKKNEVVDYDMNQFKSDFSDLVKSNMKLIFEQFDKDNDGKITKNELNFVMCNLFPDEVITEQDIDEMLRAADLDNNGFIDFDEFANMFNLYNNNHGNIDSIENSINIDSLYINNNNNTNSSNYNTITSNHKNYNTFNNNNNSQYTTGVNTSSSFSSAKLNKNNEVHKSNKSLSTSKTLSRSNSREASTSGKRSRTQSQTHSTLNSAAQSPAVNTFRKVVQLFTASHIMDLKAAFTMFDKNGDQKISESELYEVMKYLGLKTSEKEVKAMIQVVDKNRNGYVDYDEFIQMMTQTQIRPLTAEEELKKTFNIFDIDGNGFISADEIKKTMLNLGENLTDDEVHHMIKAADKNGDGKIDINEFSGLLSGTSAFQR